MEDIKVISKEEVDYLTNSIGFDFLLRSKSDFMINGEDDLTNEFKLLRDALLKFETNTGYKVRL